MRKNLKVFLKALMIVCVFSVLACERFYQKPSSQPVKNVILMIGDGMGPQQVAQVMQYRQLTQPKSSKLSFEILFEKGVYGIVDTWSKNNLATDSAAAATALGCGVKTYNGMVGMTPDGNSCESVMELANKKGKATGLVTTTRISHATPAAFVATNVSRENENQIAEEIIKSGWVDVLLGGGIRHLIPKKQNVVSLPECKHIDSMAKGSGKRTDNKNLIEEAKQKGYQFVCTKDQLNRIELNIHQNQKLLGAFSNSIFHHIQERRNSKTIPSLKNLTQKSLEILSQDENGFFLIVEGGLIDYAGHVNDAGTMLQETLDFDEAVGVAMDFVGQHPETLLVVTADHETGGFGFSYRRYMAHEEQYTEGTGNKDETYIAAYPFSEPMEAFQKLKNQNISYLQIMSHHLDQIYSGKKSPSELAPVFKKEWEEKTDYEISLEDAEYVLTPVNTNAAQKPTSLLLFSSFNWQPGDHAIKLGQVMRGQTFTTWGTGNHTSIPVFVFAYGPENITKKFQGHLDNTDIAKTLKQLIRGQ